MSLQILSDGDNAVMFCNTSDWAFGPVFSGDDHRDAQGCALDFIKWLDSRILNFERHELPGLFSSRMRLDARVLTEKGLQDAYSAWLCSTEEFGGQWRVSA